MVYLNRRTGQIGQYTPNPVPNLEAYEALVKRKVGRSNDFQDQDLYNIKEHFRLMRKGFAQLR